ncbi:MAG: chorismate mutase [Oscillospiraceae bacterium]|nr:chorismate mutase [Oscillospiraceae bacterium]MBR5364564.1 chorismate mutase [Oscillospiraceae bacterium]
MELSEIRPQLDAVDNELLALFLKRMALIDKVADVKRRDPSKPLYDPAREREILMRIRERAGSDYGDSAHQLFRTLLELSRARQAAQLIPATSVAARVAAMCANEQTIFPQAGRIAVSGVEGSHAGAAADRLFPKGDIIFMDGFPAVVQAVQAGLCKFGILPVENSVHGSVRQVYDLLREPNICIVRSVRQLIRHVLLTQKDASLSDIKTIYTHEQAAGQCSRFLQQLGADVVPCVSTAHAAQRAAEAKDKSVAAIAGEACAKLYGLSVLTGEIQNESNNDTRFLCITKGASCYAGADRMSILVNCANSPGALYQMIAKISALGINMCKLESMPIPGTNFSYRFYMDLECNLHQEGVLGLLCELERSCDSFTLLGNYTEIV